MHSNTTSVKNYEPTERFTMRRDYEGIGYTSVGGNWVDGVKKIRIERIPAHNAKTAVIAMVFRNSFRFDRRETILLE